MSYAKYTTEALVLGSREYGEADCVFALFTRDFGLVNARASAVRSERSKMRYALQKYSLTEISLVKGMKGYRAAGGVTITSTHRANPKALSAFARIAELVIRLVHGEEKNDYLFDTLIEAHRALLEDPSDSIATIEIVSVARVLYALGYISSEAFETTLFSHTSYAMEHVMEGEKMRDTLLDTINRAISGTHL